jgi:hypothetical protein
MASTTSELPPKEILIISHSTILSWWPVWLIGSHMAAFTYLPGHTMALVLRGRSPKAPARSPNRG